MAVNDMVVRIIGDSRSVERSFARSSAAANQFGRNVEKTGAKVDRSARNFSSFAKGAAAGFGGAVAFNVALNAISGIATASAEAQQVLTQTKAALESTGKSWAQYGKVIDETVTKQSRLGFDDEALLQTFSLFVRTTDDVNKALRLNSLAMDVARARAISLEQAAQLVNKAAIGQGGALRRLGIDVKATATATELLTALQAKYGGAAEASAKDSATAFERVKVSVENLQESLGSLLLPLLTTLAERLDTVAVFADNVVIALGKIGKVKIPKVELPFNITIGGKSVGDLAGDVANVAKFTPLNPLFGLTIANSIANQFRDQTEAAKPALGKSIGNAMEDLISGAIGLAGTFGITKLPSIGLDLPTVIGPTARNANALVIAQANDDLQEVLRLQKIEEKLAGEAVTKGSRNIKTREKLTLDYAQAQAAVIRTEKQIASNSETARQAAKDSADAAEQAAKDQAREARALEQQRKAREKALEQARQFRALGLDTSGGALAPTVANLTKQLNQLRSRDDLSPKAKGIIKRVGNVLSGEFGKVTDQTRVAIRELFETIRSEFDKGTKQGPLTKTTSLNANKVLAGLGLSPDQLREARARLSGFNSAGIGLSGATRPTGNFASQPVVVENHNTVTMDGEVVGRNVTRSQQKNRRRNPRQKRGPNSGV